jgi:hypothetical protein
METDKRQQASDRPVPYGLKNPIAGAAWAADVQSRHPGAALRGGSDDHRYTERNRTALSG